jgi:ribosome-binding protein aMBF1 (putative translation factor)
MHRDLSGLRTDRGDIARNRRKSLAMSQEDVAYKLKIEQTDLSKIERRTKRPSPIWRLNLQRSYSSRARLCATGIVVEPAG